MRTHLPTAQPNQSIQKGFAALEALAAAPGPMSTGELSAALKLDKSVTSRLLLTLHGLGYVDRLKRGLWRPHTALLALSLLGLKNSPLVQARPIMSSLIDRFKCIVALGTLWRDQVVYLYHSTNKETLTGFGHLFPAKESSIGLLLTQKDPPRHYLVTRDNGDISLAVPVRFRDSLFGLAIAGPPRVYKGDATIAVLEEAAKQIEALASPK